MDLQNQKEQVKESPQSYTDRRLICRALVLAELRGKGTNFTELDEKELREICIEIDKRFKMN